MAISKFDLFYLIFRTIINLNNQRDPQKLSAFKKIPAELSDNYSEEENSKE